MFGEMMPRARKYRPKYASGAKSEMRRRIFLNTRFRSVTNEARKWSDVPITIYFSSAEIGTIFLNH